MIPYFYIHTIQLGPLMIQTWGLLVAIGFLTGIWLASRKAKRDGLNPNTIWDVGWWVFIGAVIGARLGHVFFYNWNYFSDNLIDIFKIWQGGLSSFGGITGATVAFLIYNKKRWANGNGDTKLQYGDALIYAWPLGHGIARIGCFINHLHIGKLSRWPIAIAFPDGPRLDMGLIESVILLSYALVTIFVFGRKKHFTGFFLVAAMIFYGVTRFILDFARATDIPMADARYLGLTPAQYGGIILVVLGIYATWRTRFQKSDLRLSKNSPIG